MEKEEVKIWLKTIGKDRYWLAEKLLCKKRTIDSWLSSSADVPAKVERLIARLMTQHPASAPLPPSDDENTLTLTVDAPTFDSWNAAAMEEGKLLRQWAIDVLNIHTTLPNK